MAYYQQGDVLIKPFNMKDAPNSWRFREIPERNTRLVNELVVAEGEATGHSHKIVGRIKEYIAPRSDDPIVFELTEDCTIYHEEHGEIFLPAGTYIIEQVQEFDHFTGRSSSVVD